MLSSVSWPQYIAAIFILSIFYYGYVMLRYYQAESKNFWNRKKAGDTAASAPLDPASILGLPKRDHVEVVTDEQALNFAEAVPDASPAAEIETISDEQPVAKTLPSEELEAEATRLIEAFKEVDDKNSFTHLLQILIEPYKRLTSRIDIQCTLERVVDAAKGKLAFSLSVSDFEINN